MFIVKSFCTNDTMVNNNPGVTANFGELSTQSLTYSTEIGIYGISTQPAMSLYTFSVSNASASVSLPDQVRDQMIAVAAYVYSQMGSSGGLSSAQFATLIINRFASSITDVLCGDIVSSGTLTVPAWVSFSFTNISTLGDNFIKIWFSDNAFKAQYDEFKIVVIPPITVIDDFFKSATTVSNKLSAVTTTDYIAAFQTARGDHPETFQVSLPFNYVDPLNSANKISTNWGALVYGAAGNNPDAISDAIINFVLAHSTHARADWVSIFPDIFKRTEFTLIPLWDQYAIPNRTVQAGLYSPVVKLSRAATVFKTIANTYPPAHIDLYLEVFSHPYKSLQIVSCGGPDNRNNYFTLESVYSDYINVQTTGSDFARMTQDTQNWIIQLNQLLLVAETMTPYTSLPNGVTKVTRNNKLYATMRLNNIVYFVLAKSSLDI